MGGWEVGVGGWVGVWGCVNGCGWWWVEVGVRDVDVVDIVIHRVVS